MRVQVLIDGVGKGSLDLCGAELARYGKAISAFNQLVCDAWDFENPESPDYLNITSDVQLKAKRRRPQ